MISKWNHIIIKALCILLFIFIFYKLTDLSFYNNNINNNSQIETFENSIENEKINYLKLRETYIEPNDTSLDLLYVNYSGEEVGNNVWKKKTLDQCTDICNNMKGCSGFSRDLVLDTEPASCYPINVVNKCYSNRKGNLSQMQNAIKYNSFVKSNVPNILNKCIGDTNLTLNRLIFIKSYNMPNSFLGVSGDSRVLLIEKSMPNFNSSCNFRIVQGKDGVGTVSFLHIDTGKYLFRDVNNNLILNNISSGLTENNQRASFNLYDSPIGSESITLKAMSIEGETTEKFIKLDDNYLSIKPLPNIDNIDNTNNKDSKDSYNIYNDFTFYIVDSIINSNIITNKINMPNVTMPNITMPNITMSNTIINQDQNQNQENFTVTLDSTYDLPVYNNIFTTPTNFVLNDYLQDNYMPESSSKSNYTSISNKYNNIVINNQLSTSLTKNSEQYNSIYNLNLEIEKEIANLNLGLNAKNDKLINGLDKMRITDMANDYFFLKTLNSKNNKKNDN